jgi:hypothetical protein
MRATGASSSLAALLFSSSHQKSSGNFKAGSRSSIDLLNGKAALWKERHLE